MSQDSNVRYYSMYDAPNNPWVPPPFHWHTPEPSPVPSEVSDDSGFVDDDELSVSSESSADMLAVTLTDAERHRLDFYLFSLCFLFYLVIG